MELAPTVLLMNGLIIIESLESSKAVCEFSDQGCGHQSLAFHNTRSQQKLTEVFNHVAEGERKL